ncbi:MAG: heme exporter protein CcmD [Candidatus Nitrosotenuis sp.]
MGGYAYYVWPVYALALIVFLINLILPWRQHRRFLKKNKMRNI